MPHRHLSQSRDQDTHQPAVVCQGQGMPRLGRLLIEYRWIISPYLGHQEHMMGELKPGNQFPSLRCEHHLLLSQ